MKKYCPYCGAKLSEDKEQEVTYVGFIIDESGSMYGNETKTINGIKDYIKKLKTDKVNANLTLVSFNSDSGIRTILENKKISTVSNDSLSFYNPSGCTPLYDAIGYTITKIDNLCHSNKVIIITVTDGLENSSIKYTRDSVRKMIELRQEKGWAFVYLGANQDSWLESGKIGINAFYTTNYDVSNTHQAYKACATMTSCYTSGTVDGSMQEILEKEIGKN